MLENLRRYLLDAGAAWDEADDAQRNRFLHRLTTQMGISRSKIACQDAERERR